MQPVEQFDSAVKELITRYSIYHSSLRDISQQAMQRQMPHEQFTRELYKVSSHHVHQVTDAIGYTYAELFTVSSIMQMSGVGHLELGRLLAIGLEEFIARRYELAYNNIVSQMHRDEHKAVDNHQRGKLGLLVGVTFQYRDTMGRQRAAEGYMRTEGYSLFYDAWNTAVVFLLRRRGDIRGMIYRPGHAMHNEQFVLAEYETRVTDWFHPNANALVMPVTAA